MNRLNARTKTFETLSAARAHALAISIKFPREYVAIVKERDVRFLSMCIGYWVIRGKGRSVSLVEYKNIYSSFRRVSYFLGGSENTSGDA